MLSYVKKVYICVFSERINFFSYLFYKNELVCVCSVCWFYFFERKYFDYYLNVFYVDKDKYNCYLCNEKFNSKEDLVNYYFIYQFNIKYSCGICKEFIEFMSCLQEVINYRNVYYLINSFYVLLLCLVFGCNESFDEDIEFLQYMIYYEIG